MNAVVGESLYWCMVVVLSATGFTAVILLIEAVVIEFRRGRREMKQERQPRPVNAIADYTTWKRWRRVTDRAKWDTDFYELEHGEPLPAWAHDSLVLGQVPPPTGPPREPPTDTTFRRRLS